MKPGIISLYLVSTILGIVALPSQIPAQISSDGTLSTTVTTDDDLNFLIENGDRAGDNLFHSFSEFSIPNLGEAYFNNNPNIVNIFSRVTGGNISDIQGLIRANGAANLFLINPAGIVFGENASLDIGGSFFASTAENLVFGDGREFSATEPEAAPMLTVNITPGLQYGDNPLPIDVFGANLAVNSGQTLALVGGNINITNGNLTTEQGTIELGSVASTGLVSLAPTSDGFTLGYDDVDNFGNISLNQSSRIDVSGEGAGNINLQGGTINILDDSFLQANTLGAQGGGSIVIKASESIEFISANLNAQVLADATGRGADVAIETNSLRLANGALIFLDTSSISDTGDITIKAADLVMSDASFIYIFIEPGATGNGGDINLEVEQLELRDASQIGSGIFGAGNGSDINLKATSIEASGESVSGLETSLIVSVVIPGATGDAGDISVEAETISLREGAQIFTGTFGEGDAGNIDIKANSIELIGESPTFGFSSSILASASQAIPDVTLNDDQGDVSGASGSINIETETLQVLDGASVSSFTNSVGDASNINIQATEVEVIGTNSDEITNINNVENSVITTRSRSSGNGGDINLDVERLSIRDGGEILANALDTGNAGNVFITANEVEVLGASPDGTIVSGINVSSEDQGDAGSVTITADDLTIANLGTITVSSTGSGDAGNVNVTADNILLDNQGSLQGEVAIGNQGNINLNSQFLLLRRNSNITTNAGNQANGGNISIETVNLVALENSDITANALQGQGGNIIVTAQGLFLSPDSQITASSEFGVDGVVTINNPEADNSGALLELPKDTTDPSQQIAEGCEWVRNNSFIVTGRGGMAKNPANILVNDQMWSDIRNLSDSQSSEIQSSATQPAVIEANAWIVNEQGNVELVAVVNNQSVSLIASNCSG